MNHIVIFDIGKTNKKCFVFDEDYRIVWEKSAVLAETTDEDGDPCEDLELLTRWIEETFEDLLNNNRFTIRAADATTYGASFVHLGADGKPVAPLYNYLKPFPQDLKAPFFKTYGGEEKLSLETASPSLGNLNSGLQLYWLKHRRPEVYKTIRNSLHLPQYVASLLHSMVHGASKYCSEPTSIGCHTMLWDFEQKDYHRWVKAEGINQKFPPFCPEKEETNGCYVGNGFHDSSAALIPYLTSFQEPFVLISTGTWCISLNPFNTEPLTSEELAQDCLCYLTADGKPVKAARYFGGHEHEQAVLKIAGEYGLNVNFFQKKENPAALNEYATFMQSLVNKQVASTLLAIGNTSVSQIFVDGGFSKNELYIKLLAAAFPGMEVNAVEVAQATALGAAVACHVRWNSNPPPSSLISLKKHHA
ncbi:MAG: carbohydrate kinase [Saprospiraceae bacterium]|nr:carbohydrate kinase [Saprospiraceae bacterium]